MTDIGSIRTDTLTVEDIVDFADALDTAMDAGAWLLGDDATALATTTSEISLLAGIMEAGVRTDRELRTRATRLIHDIGARLRRDLRYGLIDVSISDVARLRRPAQTNPGPDRDDRSAASERRAA